MGRRICWVSPHPRSCSFHSVRRAANGTPWGWFRSKIDAHRTIATASIRALPGVVNHPLLVNGGITTSLPRCLLTPPPKHPPPHQIPLPTPTVLTRTSTLAPTCAPGYQYRILDGWLCLGPKTGVMESLIIPTYDARMFLLLSQVVNTFLRTWRRSIPPNLTAEVTVCFLESNTASKVILEACAWSREIRGRCQMRFCGCEAGVSREG